MLSTMSCRNTDRNGFDSITGLPGRGSFETKLAQSIVEMAHSSWITMKAGTCCSITRPRAASGNKGAGLAGSSAYFPDLPVRDNFDAVPPQPLCIQFPRNMLDRLRVEHQSFCIFL